MPVIIGVHFNPVHGPETGHFEAWLGPNIGGPAHPTKFWQGEKSITDVYDMSPDMLITAFHFSQLKVNQTCFPARTVDSPCTLFTY